ncbi:hypothetical protein GC167_01680 [bacterium]|nr:hypothetical protein [bacterium]
MPSLPACNHKILEALSTKSSTKQLVARHNQAAFGELKQMLQTVAEELNSNICTIDKSVVVEYTERGEREAMIRFSGDVLIFHQLTNAYTVDDRHELRKLSYIKEDPLRAFFGVINFYNFLNDSLLYNRLSDVGHLLGRIWINKDRHFFVEGKRQFSFLYNDLSRDVLDADKLRGIVENAMGYAIDYDLTAPPFADVRELTVFQMQNISQELRVRKSPGLGYRIHAQSQEPETRA